MEKRNYPRGRLGPSDEGQTQVAVTEKNGTVIIAFNKPMRWIGLGHEEAKALGEKLIQLAGRIRQ